MAAQVAPLPSLKLPAGPSPITAEQRHWRSFKTNLLIPSPTGAAVTHISYNPPSSGTASDLFAVTAGARVQIYSARTCRLVRTLARFDDLARSGTVRPDGRVVAAGGDRGIIQVFDASSRAILRTWIGHAPQPVWAVRFAPTSPTTLLSAGDDRTVRLWDLPSERAVVEMRGHSDYVRSAAFVASAGSSSSASSFSASSPAVVVSGSYDATVRLWDGRVASAGGCVMTFRHAAPVEDVLPLPSGTAVAAAAGNVISVLDLVAARPLRAISNHQKTVTSLSLAAGGRRLVSGGLDGHVKIFETADWNVVYGLKYESPVLSVRVIGPLDGDSNGNGYGGGNGGGGTGTDADFLSDRHLLVGTHSGLLSIRTRSAGARASRRRERERDMDALAEGRGEELERRAERRKRRLAGARRLDMIGEGADVVIAHEIDQDGGDTERGGGRRRGPGREKPWERYLRHGRYGAALDRVLDPSSDPDAPPGHGCDHLTVLTLLTALRHRGAVREALEGRDESAIQPVLGWVTAHMLDPRYAGVCIEAALHLLDLYAELAAGSAELAAGFGRLGARVKAEVERAQVACQLEGMVESLMMGGGGITA